MSSRGIFILAITTIYRISETQQREEKQVNSSFLN